MTNTPYTVTGVAPIQIYPAGLQSAVTLLNTGRETIYVTSMNSAQNGYPLTAGNSYSWRADTPLYAYVVGGVSSTMLVVDTGDVLPMGAVGINGPVASLNTYTYLGQYQFNAPIGPLSLAGYASIILVPINFGVAGFDVGILWGNDGINFYDVGDGAGWNTTSVGGVYITSVKAGLAQFAVTNSGGSNVFFNVYASANPIPGSYFNSANPAVAPFEAQKTYVTNALAAGTGQTIQVASLAGQAHVTFTTAGVATNTNNGLIVEFNDGAGRLIDRHVMFDPNPFQAATYDVVFPRRAVQVQVTNFTAVVQTVTVSVTYDT